MGHPTAAGPKGPPPRSAAEWHEVQQRFRASWQLSCHTIPSQSTSLLLIIRYYVRSVKKPKERAALSLAVRIGSAAEEEHERGIAHITEHLCAPQSQQLLYLCMQTRRGRCCKGRPDMHAVRMQGI